MRISISRHALQRILRWTHRALITLGVAVIGYCGFILADAWMFQKRANAELDRRLEAKHAVPLAATITPPAVGADGLIGRIEVTRIGLSAVVFEGTDRKTLQRAAGHVADTAFPGQAGNIGIAGHRDTFFRPLRDIHQDDIVTLTTLRGEFRYRVVSARVVVPTEVSVLTPTENEVLTLVTCYPFYFVGSAPSRFIVRAERVL
ncbi:MAG: class D sortase [Acidobacteriota bacterium]